MQSSSPDALSLLRQLEILESPQGELEIAPGWRQVERSGALVFLDARGRQRVVTDRIQAAVVEWLSRRRMPCAELVRAVAQAARQPERAVAGGVRELLLQQLLRPVVAGAAEDSLADPLDTERFACQLAYFRAHEAVGRSAADMQRRLLSSTVAIVGLGGLGCCLAQLLLAAGVRGLRLVDGDTVERSNLPRQFLFGEGDVGRPKADALARRLAAFDGKARLEPVGRFVRSQQDALRAVEAADFVLLCADAPALRLHAWIGEACMRAKLPYLSMSGPWVGPLFVPSHSPCYLCQSRFNARELPDVGLYLDTFLDAPHEPLRPAFPPGPNLTACLMATAAIEYLTGIDRLRLARKRFLVDVHGNHSEMEMPRYLDCDRCGGE